MAATLTAIPSKDRIEPGSVNIAPGEFPSPASSTSPPSAPDAASAAAAAANKIASSVIAKLNEALANQDVGAISQLFLENGYWRDHLALTWDYHTLAGREKISQFLNTHGVSLTKFEIDTSTPFRTPHFGPIDGGLGQVSGVEFFVKFTSKLGSGEGVARLAEESAGQWKIFLLSTTLFELTGHERRINRLRPKGVTHGGDPGRKNWKEKRDAEINFTNTQPTVIIVGKSTT